MKQREQQFNNIEILCKKYRAIKDESRFSTGFSSLDQSIHLVSGDVLLLSGRPGSGKTSFIMSSVNSALSKGKKVLLYSKDLSEGSIVSRFISLKTGESLASVILETVPSEIIENAIGEVEKYKLHIINGSVTDDEMASAINDLDEIDYVFIDGIDQILPSSIFGKLQVEKDVEIDSDDLTPIERYLGNCDKSVIINPNDRRVSECINKLKKVIHNKECVIISTVQHNRMQDYRHDGWPHIEDLRKYGDVERTADVILLLRKSLDYDSTESNERKKCEIIIAKNFGSQGVHELIWDSNTVSFMDKNNSIL